MREGGTITPTYTKTEFIRISQACQAFGNTVWQDCQNGQARMMDQKPWQWGIAKKRLPWQDQARKDKGGRIKEKGERRKEEGGREEYAASPSAFILHPSSFF
jgi:hypothetical protein